MKLFLGGQDVSLVSIPTTDLRESARELSVRIKKGESSTSANVEAIELAKDKLTMLIGEIKRRDFRRNVTSDVPMPTPAQLAIIGDELFFNVPEGLQEQIAELQSAYVRDGAEMQKYFPNRATTDFLAHEAKLNELAVSGKSVSDHETWTRDQWYDDYRNKLNALRKAQMAHVGKAKKLIAPLVEEFQTDLAETVAIQETKERDLAARYQVPFKPSQVLLLKMKVILAIEENQFPGGTTPAELAAFIVHPATIQTASLLDASAQILQEQERQRTNKF